MCSRTPNESHRLIYGKWLQALGYFDASPRCPSLRVTSYFNRNVVVQYLYERSAVDGV